MLSFNSYTVAGRKIQSTRIAALALAGLFGGCSPISMPLGSADVETPLVLTGSLPNSLDVAYTDIGAEDRRLIANALLSAMNQPKKETEQPEDQAPLTWSNPESGNSGTIAELETSDFENSGCLSFKTTANTIEGVRLYNGTACRDISQKLAITALNVSKT